MKRFCVAAVISLLLSPLGCGENHIQYSPDDTYFVGWTDFEAAAPIGNLRVIVVRTAQGGADVFTRVSTPRYTLAKWSPDSRQCFISDSPDNVEWAWLLVRRSGDEWQTLNLKPFAKLEEAYHKANPSSPILFKPSVLKIEWLSAEILQLRGYCNSGTYCITIDTANPERTPFYEKFSDGLLEK